jgi:segregation and condensation protein A
MGDVLGKLADGNFHVFDSLFNVEEGRAGVVVTFLSVLELAKEQLLEIVQEAPAVAGDARNPGSTALLAPIYVKSLAASNSDAANDPDAFLSELPEPTSDEHGLPGAETADGGDSNP